MRRTKIIAHETSFCKKKKKEKEKHERDVILLLAHEIKGLFSTRLLTKAQNKCEKSNMLDNIRSFSYLIIEVVPPLMMNYARKPLKELKKENGKKE